MIWVLALLVAVSLAQENGEIQPAPSPAPGVLERCDVFESCLPYSSRFQYSLDFFCCETGSGWVAAHSLNPLGVAFFFGSFSTALAVAFWFEAFEVGVLTLFTSFIIFETRELELETWAGSILGDALIQGGLGAFLGTLLLWAYDITGPLRSWAFMNNWLRVKYLALWIFYASSFIPLTFVGENGEHWGLFIAIGIHAVYLFGILPFSTRSRSDNLLVWQRRKYEYKTVKFRSGVSRQKIPTRSSYVPERDRWMLFGTWFVINVLLASQTTGLYFWAASDYYSVWSATALSIIGLLIIGAIRRQ